MTQFDQITEHIFLGAGICCKEHAKDYRQNLIDLDIFCDIDLRSEYQKIWDKEAIDVQAKLQLPTPDTYPNTIEQVKVGAEMIDLVVDMGKDVYVHCQYGQGRSPTFLIAYFIIKKGMSLDEAYDFVRSKRQEAHPTDKQREFLKMLEESL